MFDETWIPSSKFLDSEMLKGWYFEGHVTVTNEPEDPLIEYPEGYTAALIFYFTDAKGLAELYPDGEALLNWDEVVQLHGIDDTTRFEIDTSKFELKITKGNISEELRMFIQKEIDQGKKEFED